MNVKQLRAFVTVAKFQSFAQAGEHLHISQPALSLTIKALEENLGGALLTRTTRSVSLTAEGEVLLPLARRLRADWDDTEERPRTRFTRQLARVSVARKPAVAGTLRRHSRSLFRQP